MAMHNAELLHRFSSNTCKGVEQAFNEVKDKLTWTDNETILDVGCGTGNVTTNVVTKFVPPNSNIIAADISEKMISFAKNLYNNSQIMFKILDITDDNLWVNWEKEQFTKVFSFYVLQRIKEDRKAYINMFNFLKPDGEIMLLFPINHKVDEISTYLAKLPKYSAYAEELCKMKFHISPREDHIVYTSELLTTLGFEVILCKPTIIDYTLASTNDLVEIYGMASRLSEILPKDLFDEALEDSKTIVRDNKILEETKNGYVVKYTVLIVIAKKPH